jgi:nitrogen fixation-related uncharacterized protein
MGQPPASADVKIEYLGQRPGRMRGRGPLLWLAASGVAMALLAILVLLAVAYARQSERVDDLQAQNESILDDHNAIGQQFAKQSTRFTKEARKLERRSSRRTAAASAQAARRRTYRRHSGRSVHMLRPAF